MLHLHTFVSSCFCGWKRAGAWTVIRKMWLLLATGAVLDASFPGLTGWPCEEGVSCSWGPFWGTSHVGYGRPSTWLKLSVWLLWSALSKAQPGSLLTFCPWFPGSQHPYPSHRNTQNTGELFSLPADFSILLFLSGLLPGAPQQDCGKLPRNLFNCLPTRWSQRHMLGSHSCSSMSLASGDKLRGFTVSPEGSNNGW